MRRWLAALLIVLCFAGRAAAQYPGAQGPIMFSSNCANSPQFGLAYLCFDTTKNGFYNYSTNGFTPAINSWAFLSASAGNAQGATDYLEAGSLGSTAAQATQATAFTIAPVAGTATNLRCRNATAADNSTGITYTVYGGSAGTTSETLTCTTSTGAASTTLCSDTTDSFAVSAGDLLTVKVVNGNSSAANGVTECSFMVH